MACDFIKIDGTDVPGVTGINTNHLLLADKQRTLNGGLRQTVLVRKREWTAPLRVTGAERQQVIALVNSTPSSRTVIIDEIGSVTAFVSISADARVRQSDGTGGHDFLGGNLTLLIEEA